MTQYKGGLTNQLTVLNADMTALQADEAVANLVMNRRDQKIALASALGGGYVDTSADTAADTAHHADASVANNTTNPAIAAR
jgi:outer membrane protein TolC